MQYFTGEKKRPAPETTPTNGRTDNDTNGRGQNGDATHEIDRSGFGVNPYMNFMIGFRKHNEGKTAVEMAKAGGRAWQRLTPAEKEVYALPSGAVPARRTKRKPPKDDDFSENVNYSTPAKRRCFVSVGTSEVNEESTIGEPTDASSCPKVACPTAGRSRPRSKPAKAKAKPRSKSRGCKTSKKLTSRRSSSARKSKSGRMGAAKKNMSSRKRLRLRRAKPRLPRHCALRKKLAKRSARKVAKKAAKKCAPAKKVKRC